MSRLTWTPRALHDLERLDAFLDAKNAHAAARAMETIYRKSALLEDAPEIGRPMRDGRRREYFIPFGNGCYVLRYAITNDGGPRIMRVWHSREAEWARDE